MAEPYQFEKLSGNACRNRPFIIILLCES